MRLLLRRDQRAGVLGKVIFTLTVRAELSPQERDAITKYKLGDTFLYARDQVRLEEESFKGLAKLWIKHAFNITVKINDLVNGKIIECKDIVEMLGAEAQVKEAAQNFGAILRAAAHFGGEEVVEL